MKNEVLNYVRKETKNMHVPCYNICGVKHQKDLLLPIWYSDTKKLCYPDMYYTEDDVKNICESLNKKFNLNAIYEKHYIGGFHCKGWCIRIK